MEEIAVSYFDELFQTTSLTCLSDTLEAMDSTITLEANQRLLLTFFEDEVWVALFQMHPFKAPGPDSMSSVF